MGSSVYDVILLPRSVTAFLDFPSQVEVMLLLSRLAHDMQKFIFLSTHDFDLALQTADRLWLMGKGGKFDVGTPRELSDKLPLYFPSPHTSFDPDSLRFNIKL